MVAMEIYRSRLDGVLQDIEQASLQSSSPHRKVRVIGVTKTVAPSEVDALLDAGVTDFGENRWQHAREMIVAERAGEATWHFIGHLQSNKVKYIVPNFTYIHSIDSIQLGREIEACAVRYNRKIIGLVQVNVSGEETKSGVRPEAVRALVKDLAMCSCLEIQGLMTMAPAGADPAMIRSTFRRLRELQEDIRQSLGMESFCELSMGMSEDFPLAVREGATMIRVGRRIMA